MGNFTGDKGKGVEDKQAEEGEEVELELSAEDLILIRETWKQIQTVMNSHDNEFDRTIWAFSLAPSIVLIMHVQ